MMAAVWPMVWRTSSSSGVEAVCRLHRLRRGMLGARCGERSSGEREEQFLEFGFGHRFRAVGPGATNAFPQAGRDDLESGPVQGAGYRGELGDHVLAVAAL